MDYIIKKTNPFSDKILGETVGAFSSPELAREYVDFKASQGDSYAVVYKGEILYPDD